MWYRKRGAQHGKGRSSSILELSFDTRLESGLFVLSSFRRQKFGASNSLRSSIYDASMENVLRMKWYKYCGLHSVATPKRYWICYLRTRIKFFIALMKLSPPLSCLQSCSGGTRPDKHGERVSNRNTSVKHLHCEIPNETPQCTEPHVNLVTQAEIQWHTDLWQPICTANMLTLLYRCLLSK